MHFHRNISRNWISSRQIQLSSVNKQQYQTRCHKPWCTQNTNKTFFFNFVIQSMSHTKHTFGQTAAEQLRHLLNIINAAHMYPRESPPYCGGGVCVPLWCSEVYCQGQKPSVGSLKTSGLRGGVRQRAHQNTLMDGTSRYWRTSPGRRRLRQSPGARPEKAGCIWWMGLGLWCPLGHSPEKLYGATSQWSTTCW